MLGSKLFDIPSYIVLLKYAVCVVTLSSTDLAQIPPYYKPFEQASASLKIK